MAHSRAKRGFSIPLQLYAIVVPPSAPSSRRSSHELYGSKQEATNAGSVFDAFHVPQWRRARLVRPPFWLKGRIERSVQSTVPPRRRSTKLHLPQASLPGPRFSQLIGRRPGLLGLSVDYAADKHAAAISLSLSLCRCCGVHSSGST